VITRMWSPVRRKESATLEEVIAVYRPLVRMSEPATLEGGDVVRIGMRLFVGLSRRTNRAGVEQFARLLAPYGYRVEAVAVQGCLHLKSACCFLGEGTLLANRKWIDPAAFGDVRILDVPEAEPQAANALAIGRDVIVSSAFPRTREVVERNGWTTHAVDNSELRKAEAAVTCSSILFDV
jgi:dimethylargininase